MSMPISKARGLQRFFFSGAAEVEPDKQGRILLPQHLRDYAHLTRTSPLSAHPAARRSGMLPTGRRLTPI